MGEPILPHSKLRLENLTTKTTFPQVSMIEYIIPHSKLRFQNPTILINKTQPGSLQFRGWEHILTHPKLRLQRPTMNTTSLQRCAREYFVGCFFIGFLVFFIGFFVGRFFYRGLFYRGVLWLKKKRSK